MHVVAIFLHRPLEHQKCRINSFISIAEVPLHAFVHVHDKCVFSLVCVHVHDIHPRHSKLDHLQVEDNLHSISAGDGLPLKSIL